MLMNINAAKCFLTSITVAPLATALKPDIISCTRTVRVSEHQAHLTTPLHHYKTSHDSIRSSMRIVSSKTLLLAVITVMSCFVPAIFVAGQAGPPSGPVVCGNVNPTCTAVGNTCTLYSSRPTQALRCGRCANRNDGCGIVCEESADQTGCTAETFTCAKVATEGGFGITQPCGTTSLFAAADALQQPAVFTANASNILAITLTVRLRTLNATVFSFQSRLFCYTWQGAERCTAPGPTFKLHPGDRLIVTLVNALPAEGSHQTTSAANTMRLPNTINFHTHGLHVSPRQDNVMPKVASGASRVYDIQMPASHAPGLHWYHSHMHGSSALHVLGGMVGAMIVENANGTSSPGFTAFDAMASSVLAVTHHPMCSCNPTSDPFAMRSIPHLMAMTGDTTALNYVAANGRSEQDVLLINGQYQPRTTMSVGEWKRFDLLNSVADVFLELEVRDAVAGGGANQGNMYTYAADGVMLSEPRRTDVALVAIGGRVGLMLKFDAAGTYYLQSNPKKRATDYEGGFAQNLLTIVVSAASATMTQPSWTSAQLTRPSYLRSLLTSTVDASFETGVDQTGVTAPAGGWLGIGTNCTGECGGRGGDCTVSDLNKFAKCAHVPFPGMLTPYRFAAPVCSRVEWTINGRGATPHPLHLHAFHFQIVSSPSAATNEGWGKPGDWRDTWPALSGKSVLRFQANRYTGAVMIHCHYLMHEDMGMMDRIWIGKPGSSACTATSLTSNCDSVVPAEAFAEEFAADSPVECSATSGATVTAGPSATSGATVTAGPLDGSTTGTTIAPNSPRSAAHNTLTASSATVACASLLLLHAMLS
jgi:FtsP/CotA-like multicopper oxidase with cupredoxin domain